MGSLSQCLLVVNSFHRHSLEYTSDSVAMIAEEVGFHSAFYLSRQFRRHSGISPRD